MDNKHHLLVNGTFLMKTVSGVQRYAREMIRAFRKIGLKNLTILAPHCYASEEYMGYQVQRDTVQLPWRNQWWLWEQLRLPRLVKKYGKSILWSPSNIGPVLVEQHIITMHDALVFSGREWFSLAGGTYYRALLPQLAKRAIHVITDSEYSRKDLIRHSVVAPGKVSVVPLGVSDDFYIRDSEESRKYYVLNLGSRDPRKNIRRLLLAWNIIDPGLRNGYRLGIVGGHIRGVVDEQIKNLILPDVDMLGYKSDEELMMLFRKSLLFIYPSLYEGFGLPPLEAMAAGLPVISSNATSLPEVCGNAALYIDPLSEYDIAEKISNMLRDEGMRIQYRERGLARARHFTWERSAHRFLEIVEKVLKN